MVKRDLKRLATLVLEGNGYCNVKDKIFLNELPIVNHPDYVAKLTMITNFIKKGASQSSLDIG